ncbi:MAG: hypothetical protein IPJ41_18580 [Phycisphaerales bacterium]|nr:hypothetical protein [Phycisphaerales bacterium]
MTRTSARQPVCVPVVAAARSIELVWDLSTRAGAALARATGLPEPTVCGVAVRLSRTAEEGNVAVLIDAITPSGERRPLRDPAVTPARWLREGAFEHLDAEGILTCTLRHESRASALYARCPLLAGLGVPAGAYSLRGAQVE